MPVLSTQTEIHVRTVLSLFPGKDREYLVYSAAFVKLLDVRQFYRCEYRFIPMVAFYVVDIADGIWKGE